MFNSIHTHTIHIDNKQVFYFHNKLKPDKPTILMLPGWPISCYMFLPIIEYLNPYFNCYCLDLPGFGQSQTDKKTYHSNSYYQNFLTKFIHKIFAHKPLILLGYSFGALHYLNLTLSNYAFIKKLILIVPLYNGKKLNQQLQCECDPHIKLMLKLIYKLKHHTWFFSLFNAKKVRKHFMKLQYETTYSRLYPHLLDNLGQEYYNLMVENTNQLDSKAAVETLIEIFQTDISHKLALIQTPSLIISGDKDVVIKPNSVNTLHKLLPKSTHVIIPNGTHTMAVTNPDIIAKEIKKFCKLDT